MIAALFAYTTTVKNAGLIGKGKKEASRPNGSLPPWHPNMDDVQFVAH